VSAAAPRTSVNRASGRANDVDAYHRRELRRLREHVAFLEAERLRLERLLAIVLRVATARAACGPLELLDVLAELLDLNPTGMARTPEPKRPGPRGHVDEPRLLELLRPTPSEVDVA
jgi:hypothetical protein